MQYAGTYKEKLLQISRTQLILNTEYRAIKVTIIYGRDEYSTIDTGTGYKHCIYLVQVQRAYATLPVGIHV